MGTWRRFEWLTWCANGPRVGRAGAVLGLAGLLALAGCGGDTKDTADPRPQSQSSSDLASDMVTISDAWVRAAESGTTSVFGTLVNGTDVDLTLTSATTESARQVDLAGWTDKKVLRQKKAGFPVKAHGKHELNPAGDQLVLIELAKPIKVGDNVAVTVTFSDKSTLQFGATAKADDSPLASYRP